MKKIFLSYIALHAVDHCNLSCVFCSNHSPFFKKKQYNFEDYEKWIDTLLEKQYLKFGGLSINGGEPFLHTSLKEFVKKFKIKYNMHLQLTTNGFWLKSLDEIKKNEKIFEYVDKLNISTYPEFQKNYAKGGLDLIYEIFKNKKLEIRTIENWTSIEFLSSPQVPNTNTRPFCAWTQLLATGQLCACPTAAYADSNKNVSVEFLNNRNSMFFDIQKDTNFNEWLNDWPRDACSYCTMWKNKKTKWINNPKIRKNKSYKKFL